MLLLSKYSNKIIYAYDWEDAWDLIYEESENKVIKVNLKEGWLVWVMKNFDYIGLIG